MVEDVIKEEVAQDSADEAETQVYELGFYIVPTVEEADLSKEVEAVKSLIESNGGTFITEESPKLIDLAYTISKHIEGKIKKFDNAYFGWIKFETKTDSIINVKEGMDAKKEILRFLIIKTVKESTLISKSAMSPKVEVAKGIKPQAPLKTAPKSEDAGEESKEPVSEAELDKTIKELVVE